MTGVRVQYRKKTFHTPKAKSKEQEKRYEIVIVRVRLLTQFSRAALKRKAVTALDEEIEEDEGLRLCSLQVSHSHPVLFSYRGKKQTTKIPAGKSLPSGISRILIGYRRLTEASACVS